MPSTHNKQTSSKHLSSKTDGMMLSFVCLFIVLAVAYYLSTKNDLAQLEPFENKLSNNMVIVISVVSIIFIIIFVICMKYLY